MARTASSVAERNNAGKPTGKPTAKKVPRTQYPPARKVIITVPSRKKIDFTHLKQGEPIKKEKSMKRVQEQWSTLILN